MLKIKKILVPTDFSEHSKAAARTATDMAKVFGAELLLLHVAAGAFDYQGYGVSAEHILEMQQQVRAAIEKELEAEARACGAAARVTLHLREGNPYEEIVACAGEQQVDLIVIATHGHTGIAHLMLGSTAERVVRLAACPVLTVRSRPA